MTKRAYQVEEFCQAYGIGKSKMYEEISDGRLHALRVGRRLLIAADDAERWLRNLPTEWFPLTARDSATE